MSSDEYVEIELDIVSVFCILQFSRLKSNYKFCSFRMAGKTDLIPLAFM